MMQHTNTLRRFCVALGVGGKEKCGKTYELFKERQQQELYHCEEMPPPPTSRILWKHATEIFLYFQIMHISSVPNYCKYFGFGTVLHINVIASADVFPIAVSGKIFLYIILIFSTFWSVVPIKCRAVVPYRITNMYGLMPITVMVLLCVNTAATVCDSSCLLGCSTDCAVDVVCDDAKKLLGMFQHWPEFDTWLITSFARTS